MTKPYYKFEATPPEKWEDRSITVFAAPEKLAGEELEANTVISRDKMETSETFGDYVKRQVAAMQADIPQFDLIDQREGQIKKLPAQDIRCRWMTPNGRIQQRIVFLSAGKGEIITYAASAADDHFEARKEYFNAILASIKISEIDKDD